MKQNEVFDFLREKNLRTNFYYNLKNIESFKLKSGREIRPDPRHLRIAFSEKYLKIQYGKSIPYGGRISIPFSIAQDLRSIYFHLDSLKEEKNTSFTKAFNPKFGDTIRFSLDGLTLSESIITSVRKTMNTVIVGLSKPTATDGRISWFESSVYTGDDYCDHGETTEGVYLKFIPNKQSINKKECIHEIIKYNEIEEIIMKEIS